VQNSVVTLYFCLLSLVFLTYLPYLLIPPYHQVPFVVYNIPEVDAVVKKWSDVDYMHTLLGGAYCVCVCMGVVCVVCM